MELDDHTRGTLPCDFELRAGICTFDLGVNSVFVRCVGQLAITVALCGCPGLLPT